MLAEHEELENSVAAYLLGSLELEEQDQMEAHLRGCASCRQLLGRLAPGIAALPLEPEPVKPPVRLEDRLVAAASAAGPDPAPRPRRSRLSVLPRRPRVRFGVPAGRAGLAAAAVLLFAAGAALGSAVDRWGPLPPGARSSSSEVQRYQLTGHGSMTGVQASAVYLKRDGLTLVDFKYLPRPGQDQVYELWLIGADGKPLPGGVFSPDSDGSKVVFLDRDLSDVRALAVTLEPGPNGSATPSQPPQLSGAIT